MYYFIFESAFEFNASICTGKSVSCAINTFFEKFLNNNYDINTCLPQCQLECYSTKILYTISSADLIGDSYVDYIGQNVNLKRDVVTREVASEMTRQSVARLRIF